MRAVFDTFRHCLSVGVRRSDQKPIGRMWATDRADNASEWERTRTHRANNKVKCKTMATDIASQNDR